MEYTNTIWPEWKIVGKIGQGTYGSVYKIEKHDMLGTEEAALKIISLPRSEDDLYMLRHSGMDDETVSRTLEKQATSILQEYKLMRALRDVPGVVHCDNYGYAAHPDGMGWDIHIQMELLTPFLRQKELIRKEADIVRFGIELCRTLENCHALGIIHRDIKPHNIFVTNDGRYKLGDFGIARFSDSTATATMGAGTLSFMAPEVFSGKRYNHTADLYSLGMVLYWLLNERRGPFLLDGFTQEEACAKRFGGEAVPAPRNGSAELQQIVLKACAFDPKDRFSSAAQMLEALKEIRLPLRNGPSRGAAPFGLDSESDESQRVSPDLLTDPEEDLYDGDHTRLPDEYDRSDQDQTTLLDQQQGRPIPSKKRSRKGPVFGIAAIGIALLALALTFFLRGRDPAPPGGEDAGTEASFPFAEFDGRYYYIFDDPVKSYADAAAFCEELGGHFADVNSAEENQFIYEYLCSLGYDHIFLGGNDSQEDGVWIWESWEPFDYQNWAEGEPNNDLGGEGHLAMYRVLTDGSWNDITFSTPSCQLAAAEVMSADASSCCTDPEKNCSVQHLLDGDPATRWCAAGSGTGIGESVTFVFHKTERLTGFTICTGGPDFENNHRPSTIRLICDDGSCHIVELTDTSGEQYVPLPDVAVTSTVELVFDDVFDTEQDIGGIAVSGIQFQTESRKTGFLCEWDSEADALAAAQALQVAP